MLISKARLALSLLVFQTRRQYPGNRELANRMVRDRLDGYGDSRQAAGAKTIAESERARRLLTSTDFVDRIIVSVGCRLINVLPPLQKRIARTVLGR